MPAGQAYAEFGPDTMFVGVLWLGPNFVAARRRGEPELLRAASATELAELRRLLGIEPR